MSNKKSLAEEALLQMENLEKVVAENAKGILASTMKEEISELVKESLKETEHEESEKMEAYEQIEDDELDMDMDTEVDTDVEDVMGDEDSEDDVMSMADIDFDSDEEGDEEEMLDVDIEPIDLTGVSDEEVLKVFKMMDDSDGIIVKQDNDEIHLSDNDEDVEYIIQVSEADKGVQPMEEEEFEDDEFVMTGDEGDMEGVSAEELLDKIFAEEQMEGDYSEMNMDEGDYSEMNMDEMNMDEMNMDEEDDIVYEIEIDEEEDMDDEDMDDSDDVNEDKMTIKPVMGNLKKAKLTTKAETKESAIEPKGKAKGVGMNLSAKKYEFSEEEMEEGKDWGSNKHEYRRKKVDGVEKKAGEGKDGHYKDYEGKFGGNKGDKSKTHPGKKDYEKAEAKESARTYAMGSKEGRGLRKGITNNRNYVYGDNGVKVESINLEVQRLREKNEEYRNALNVFREKLQEVAVFNSNLAYATRLFTEHSTTKQEKINILRRFDNIETLKESKTLYNSIKNELNILTSDVVTESVSKIDKSPASGSSQNLIESKTYENPQFLRMKDIMAKIAK
jgi:hypothetical protein